MAQIVENVRASELLYTTLEIEAEYTYRLSKGATFHRVGTVIALEQKLHCVHHNGLLYIKTIEKSDVFGRNDKPISHETKHLLGYDGELTRVLMGELANIHHGRYEDCGTFRPHTWLMQRGTGACFPLSLWLEADNRLRAHPLGARYRETQHRLSYEKQEPVDGLNCFKIACHDTGPQLVGFTYLWLCPERNYLPVKSEYYLLEADQSKGQLAGIGKVRDFREIARGVWLPMHGSRIGYDSFSLMDYKKQVVGTEEHFSVTKVETQPHYDLSLFRIPIPDGTTVYEVKDGVLFNGHLQGHTVKSWPVPRSMRGVLVAVVILAVLVSIYLMYRRAPGDRTNALERGRE